MPSCVPVSHNNVGDVNANTHPNNAQDSKLQKIMACLFWKKKTDVVDMKKEQKMAAKKKMAVDRSERSRRVLKMESMKEAPTERDADEAAPTSQVATQMFLPSENPTASFLSYLNPSVRRACSDVIKTSGSNSNTSRSQVREAFVESSKQTRTRNTNYRAKRATDGEPPTKPPDRKPWELEKPPRIPARTQSQRPAENKRPIVVPGTMACSDDDIGYNSDNEISDLQEELSRMNLSQTDLRNSGNGKHKHRRREGSISLSEGSSSEEEEVAIDRPQNPSPGQQKRMVFQKVTTDRQRETEENVMDMDQYDNIKKKSLENVIDDLFLQTQKNIDSIYKNGLENLDIETYRSDTATPETCMTRMESDLFKPTVSKGEITAEKNKTSKGKMTESNRNSVIHGMNKLQVTDIESEAVNANESPEMDNLLTEVSIWAKDRQNWLLEDGKPKHESKESTQTSFADEKVIAKVSKSNNERCSEWIDSVAKSESDKIQSENKMNGILTGPKLFRSASRNQSSRKVSFSDTDSSHANQGIETRSSSRRDTREKSSRNSFRLESLDNKAGCDTGPWTADMYSNRSKSREDDRSTINDNLSELDHKTAFRARSPDSWLSSNGSCSNLLKVDTSRDERDDFGTASPFRNTPELSVKRTASEPAKAHQIVRKKPVIHTPFASFSRQHTPMPVDSKFTPTTPMNQMVKNTQLKPLSMQVNGNFQERQFPGYKSMLSGSRNISDAKFTGMTNPRPFSEIPVRDGLETNDRLLASNASSIANNVAMSLVRPVSETVAPVKRSDKIGMGNIMATDSLKERNKYAREIVKSMSMPKTRTSIEAFQHSALNDTKVTDENQASKQKRHKVFNQKLLNGGYNYEKHSRKDTGISRDEFLDLTSGYYDPTEEHLPDIRKIDNGINSPRSLNSASVSELTLNVRDSFEGRNGMKPAVITKETMNQMFSGNRHTVDVNIGTSPSGSDVSNGDPTAVKFKRLRSRRDQEMEWLMKDAAETEV